MVRRIPVRVVAGTRWTRPAVLAAVVCVLLAVSGGEFPVAAVAGTVIAATGLMLVTAAGGFDLSTGSVAVLCGAVAGRLAVCLPAALAIALSIGLGVACGLVNGFLVTWFRWQAFLVTFGMLAAAEAAVTLVPRGEPISPNPVVACAVAAGIAIGAHVVLALTVWGFHVSFAGSNETAAERAGVMVARLRRWTYVVSGGLAAVAGVTTAAPGGGIQLQVAAIGAVLLGGTTLNGGRGTVAATVLGAVAVGMLLTMLREWFH
jgi:ribose/xylose/arabinose/galactoside ABC-type transport system permease subunit